MKGKGDNDNSNKRESVCESVCVRDRERGR